MKTFVDTNVLVYAHDTDAGDRHATAKALLAELWDGRSGSLSTQVLQEFYAVVTRKFKPAMPRAKARAIVAAYGEWCAVATEPQLIISASRLEEEHTLSFWDALIVQAAIQVGAERLVSEDLQNGRRFGVLTIENPFRRASSLAGHRPVSRGTGILPTDLNREYAPRRGEVRCVFSPELPPGASEPESG